MDRKKAKEFLEELIKLEERYGFSVNVYHEEESSRDYNGEFYISGIYPYLVLEDKKGNGLRFDEISEEVDTVCYGCGKVMKTEGTFCNEECKKIYEERLSKK